MKKAFFVSAIIAILITASVAVAASTQTWGGASNNLWATPGNWTSAVPGTTDTAQFNGAGNGNTSISLGGVSRPINTISITGASAAAYTLGVLSSGDQFNFDAGGAITEASSATTSQTINAGILANGALTISNSSITGSLSLAGNIGGASGSISYGGATNGVIKILGQNTYAGNTTINVAANTLQIGSSSNSGTLTSGPFGTGTILTNSGTNSPMQAINADQVVANPMTLTFGFTVSNAATPFNLSFTGPMTYNSASTRTLTINTPNKTVTFGSASSPSTITLNAVAATALLIDPSQNSTLVINDVMQDNGAIAGSINYNSIGNNTPMGTVQLNGANTYSGGTSLNGQTSGSPVVGLTVQIGVDTVGSPGSITSGPFGKGTVTTNGNSGGPPILQAFGADRTVANAISMTSGFFVSGLHNLNLTGPVTLGSTSRTITNNLASGLTLTFGSAGSPSTMTLGNTLIFQTQTAGGGMTIINDAISGNGGLTVQNNATVVLSNANTYLGTTTVNNATLTLTNTTGSGTGTGPITVGSNGTLQIGNGGAAGAVSGNITNNGSVSFNRSDDSSYSGQITGGGGVAKRGAGTLSLSGNNTQVGTIQYDGGLKLGNKNALGVAGYSIGDATTTTTLKVSSSTNLTGANAVGNPISVFQDFTVASGSSDLEFSGSVNLGAVNRTITVDSSNATIMSGVISGSGVNGTTGGITKAGDGVLTLTGANKYGIQGETSTFVTSGKLLVNNTTGSGTGQGNVSVTAGTLGGTGTISGAVSVSGTGHLSPGASINVLNIGANLSMTGGSFDYEINRDTVAADLNNVGGNLALAGVALSASDLGVGALPLAMGTKFTLINYGGTWNLGTFTGLANHSTNLVIGLNRFQIDYDSTTGGSNFGGGSVGAGSHYVTITAVPEASAFLVIGLGGIFTIAAVRMGKRMGINVLKA